jgi:hypothetical protein
MRIRTSSQLVAAMLDVANNQKTLYVMGSFGTPLVGSHVQRMINHHSYNQSGTRAAMIRAAADQNPAVFGFDCVNIIKGLMWGWSGDASQSNGGARYATNGVPDTNANGMFNLCRERSSDFSKVQIGSAVWLSGHIGIYIGDGKVVESTPSWKNGVQITGCRQSGINTGLPSQNWQQHGLLPFIEYENQKCNGVYLTIGGSTTLVNASLVNDRWVASIGGARMPLRDILSALGYESLAWNSDTNTIIADI